jgi:hypothetical protein
MWPFSSRQERRPVVVLHIDQYGLAKGAFFRGEADVLIVDERDPQNRVYRLTAETPSEELRRRIGRHPLGRLVDDDAASMDRAREQHRKQSENGAKQDDRSGLNYAR